MCNQFIKPLPINLLNGIEHKRIQNVDGVYSITNTGEVFSHKRNQFLKKINRRVPMLQNNSLKSFSINKLVAEYFYPNYKDIKEPFIQHIDDDKDNCHINNLKVF